MTKIVLTAFVCCYNELSTGNLERLLTNLKLYCDHIAVYDDASTDGTTEFLRKHATILVEGKENNHDMEMSHKQQLLESIEKDLPDTTHLLFIDADEILDAKGTREIRNFCAEIPRGIEGINLPIRQIWRSQCWERLDGWYNDGQNFCRIWKFKKGLIMQKGNGLHKTHFPINLGNKVNHLNFGILHYGYAHTDFILKRYNSRQGVPAEVRGVALDERTLKTRLIPLELFPPHARPDKIDDRPTPIVYKIVQGRAYNPPEEKQNPLKDQ